MRAYKPNRAIDHRFSPQWRWQEFLQQDSFWGSQFTDVEAANEPFGNWNELIGLIANTVAANRALISRM